MAVGGCTRRCPRSGMSLTTISFMTVHICSTPLADLPFNVRQLNTIHYEINQIHLLEEPLAECLQEIVG